MLNYKAFIQMRKLIKDEKVDIVHENALTAYVAAWAAESLGVPVVWHIREFMEEDLNISFYNKQYSIEKINKATHIIAISKAIAQKWGSIFSVPMTVIYDGLPIENYYIKRVNKESNWINIIIYGRIVETKGQLFFFEGMKQLFKYYDNIKCFWAGQIEDEEYYNSILTFINDNNIGERVRFLGQISNMKTVLKEMDIVAVCSKQEGFGRVTVEAMLSGCIVVGANTGATKELIEDGVNGFLYNEGDINSFVNVFKHVIEDFLKNKKLAINSQIQAKDKYSINNNVENIIKIYKKVY